MSTASTLPLTGSATSRIARRGERQSARGEAWRRRTPLLPALIFTIIVTQVPFVFTVIDSFKYWNLVRPGSEHWVGLANYEAVFRDSQFRNAALVTIELTVGWCSSR